MSAPGSKDQIPNQSEVKDIVEPQAVATAQPIRKAIGVDQFPGYTPQAGDHITIDPQLSMGACQIVGLRPEKGQQDAYQAVPFNKKLFPQNYRLAKELIFAAWESTAQPYKPGEYKENGGCTAIAAISHQHKLYVSHLGDSRAFLILRDPATYKIIHFTRLQFRFHQPQEPSEMARYAAGQFTAYNGVTRIKRLDGGSALTVTRSVGDVAFPVLTEPDLLVCDLAKVKGYIVDLLVTSDGPLDLQSEEQILNILASCEAKETADLAKQVEALIQAALKAGSKDNQTGIMKRLSKGEPGPLEASMTILCDGHGDMGKVIADNTATTFLLNMNTLLSQGTEYTRPPDEKESKYDAKKEEKFRQVRLNDQQYILNFKAAGMKTPTALKDSLKKFFFEFNEAGYILDCTTTKISVNEDKDSGYRQVKEIAYCTLNRWQGRKQTYNPLFCAQLEMDFIYKSNELVSVQALFSLQSNIKEFENSQRIGILSKIINFNDAEQAAKVKASVKISPSKPAWAWHLNDQQIAEVKETVSRKLTEAKSTKTPEEFLKETWGTQPSFFWNFYSGIFGYQGWLTEFYTPGNQLLHPQLMHYQNSCFTTEPAEKLVLLYKMLETIKSMANDTAYCWSSNNGDRQYRDAIASVVELINVEIAFLIYFQPDLPKSDCIPCRLVTRGNQSESYPSFLRRYGKSALCCFFVPTAIAVGAPLVVGSFATAAIAGSATGVGVGIGEFAVNKLVGAHFERRTEKMCGQQNAVVQGLQVTNVSDVQKIKAEQKLTLQLPPSNVAREDKDLVGQYLKAIANKDISSKQDILEDKSMSIFNAIESMLKEDLLNAQSRFEFIIMDKVFIGFIKEKPDAVSRFREILNSSMQVHKDRYPVLVKLHSPEVYGIMYPVKETNLGLHSEIPGVVPKP